VERYADTVQYCIEKLYHDDDDGDDDSDKDNHHDKVGYLPYWLPLRYLDQVPTYIDLYISIIHHHHHHHHLH